jgi:hypothetical protein
MAAMYHVYVTENNRERISFSFPFNIHNLYFIFVTLFQGQVIKVSALPDPVLFLQEIKNKIGVIYLFHIHVRGKDKAIPVTGLGDR